MNNLFKPTFVEVRIKENDYIEVIKSIIEGECGVSDFDMFLSVDDETGFVRTVIDEYTISEEDEETLSEYGYNIQEWYLLTEAILRKIFNTENVSSYVNLDEYDAMCENNELIVPIQVGFEDYINLHNTYCKTPKGNITAVMCQSDYFPAVKTYVGNDLATITEYNYIKDAISIYVYDKDNDDFITTVNWNP